MALLRLLAFVVISVVSTGAFARQPVYFSAYVGGEEHDVDYLFAGNLSFEPEDDGDTWGVGVGYAVNDNWMIELDFTRSDADDVDIDQLILSVNYQFPFLLDGMQATIGLVVGEGSLEWNDQPDFADALTDDLDNDEALYGFQVGLNYDLAEHWSTSLKYQYFDQEFNTNVETVLGRLEFEHNNFQYLLFAIRYHL